MFALFLLALYYSQIRRGVQVMLEKLINLINPVECSECGRPKKSVCDDCWQKLVVPRTPACFWCNTLVETGKTCSRCSRKTHLKGATIPYRLDGIVKTGIYQLKYGGDRNTALLYGSKIAQHLPPVKFDCVGYVPSTGKSTRKRGYNQAQLIAKQVARETRLPLEALLLRLAHTDQIGLNRAQRLSSVDGDFIARSNCAGKTILLCDDVVTTGATLNECAYTLKIAGATAVWGLAVAKK
jgi:ComF family protein